MSGTPATIEHANAIEDIGFKRGYDTGYEKGFLAGAKSRENEVQESRKWRRFLAALVRKAEGGKLEISRDEMLPYAHAPRLTIDDDTEGNPHDDDYFVRGERIVVRIAE